MLGLIQNLPIIRMTQESEEMAQEFISSNLVPPKELEDAQHLALAVEFGFDFMVSWNYSHMINARTQKKLPVLSAA